MEEEALVSVDEDFVSEDDALLLEELAALSLLSEVLDGLLPLEL